MKQYCCDNVEVLGETCIDGGTCHHKCTNRCFRRESCTHFSDYTGPWAYDEPAPAQAEQKPVGWIHEDKLPEGYPYDAMFPFSKVDVVRMFPVYAPIAQTESQPVAWECRCACDECTGADWTYCSFEQYQMALADPDMEARELYAAPVAQAEQPDTVRKIIKQFIDAVTAGDTDAAPYGSPMHCHSTRDKWDKDGSKCVECELWDKLREIAKHEN